MRRGAEADLLFGLDALLHEDVDQLVPVGAERVGGVQMDLARRGSARFLEFRDAFREGSDQEAGFLPLLRVGVFPEAGDAISKLVDFYENDVLVKRRHVGVLSATMRSIRDVESQKQG